MAHLRRVELPVEEAALFLDFDGTLVEIAPTPDSVVVPEGLVDVLAALRGRLGGALAVVSGRPIAALDGFLSPLTFDAAGLHGAELRVGGHALESPATGMTFPLGQLEQLKKSMAGLTGLLVEEKGRSVALHWRLAPDLGPFVQGEAATVAAELGPDWRLQQGKDVVEILPAAASKGAAIERLLAEEPYRGRIPVFIGDDVTDEHGFAAVLARSGLAIRIGDGPTMAPARLPSPGMLRHRLADWAAGAPIDPASA
jgi:trehalose 6-phosphate phosphatase